MGNRRTGLWFVMMIFLGFGLASIGLALIPTLIVAGTAGFVGGAYLSHTGGYDRLANPEGVV